MAAQPAGNTESLVKEALGTDEQSEEDDGQDERTARIANYMRVLSALMKDPGLKEREKREDIREQAFEALQTMIDALEQMCQLNAVLVEAEQQYHGVMQAAMEAKVAGGLLEKP